MIVEEMKAKSMACAIAPSEHSCRGAKCMAWRWLDGSALNWGFCGHVGAPDAVAMPAPGAPPAAFGRPGGSSR